MGSSRTWLLRQVVRAYNTVAVVLANISIVHFCFLTHVSGNTCTSTTCIKPSLWLACRACSPLADQVVKQLHAKDPFTLAMNPPEVTTSTGTLCPSTIPDAAVFGMLCCRYATHPWIVREVTTGMRMMLGQRQVVVGAAQETTVEITLPPRIHWEVSMASGDCNGQAV